MKYSIVENKYLGKVDLQLNGGFSFTPKINNSIAVKSITIYDQKLISWFIYNRFIKKYKKLVGMVMSLLQDSEASDGDVKIVLDEIVHQKQIIMVKYEKFLKEKELEEYFKKLDYLAKEVKSKYFMQRLVMASYPMNTEEEKKGKSR